MGVKVDVTGTQELRLLANRLAAASDGRELRRDLGRNIRAATKPAIAGVKTNLRAGLPKRGGLNDYFARSSIGTRTTLSGKSVGVRIVAQKKGHDIVGLDAGLVRHPVYGNRNRWVSQSVPARLITGPLEAAKPGVQRGVIDAMDATADRITRGI